MTDRRNGHSRLIGRPLNDDGAIAFTVCRTSESDIPTEPATDEARLRDEVSGWREAAQIIGENLASSGPMGYYDYTPQEWLTWALAAIRMLNERLLARNRELAELKVFHYRDTAR